MLRGMHRHITDVVADVLNEHDVVAARALLAEAIMAASDTEMATRVDARCDRPDAGLRIHGHGFRPPAEAPPGAQQIRDHPLYRYRMQTGDAGPTRLEEVMREGWRLSDPTRHPIETLHITVHQVTFPVAARGEYEGWSLLSPGPISRLQLRALVEHANLLRGLDSHVDRAAGPGRCGRTGARLGRPGAHAA